MSDIHTLKETIESAISRAESAAWDAEQAADNAGDARDSIQNVESILNDVLNDIDGLIGFDKDAFDIAVSNVKPIINLLKFYLERVEEAASKNLKYEPRYSMLVSAINLVTTGYQEIGWDEGYTMESDYIDGQYCIVFKKVKQEENNNG
jgi:phage-related protein